MRSDSDIQKDVIDQLDYDPLLKPEGIGVSVVDGIVTLSGSVPSYPAKRSAEKSAGRVSGVKAVASKLCINIGDGEARPDQEIAKAAIHTLLWNTLLPRSIQVAVERGAVILRGEVEWAYQKTAAQRAIQSIKGIREIKNHIHITHLVNAEEVRKKIRNALYHAVAEDSHAIRVDSEGNTVHLSGQVSSRKVAEIAVWAAWTSDGVTHVDDRIEIS